MNALLPEMDLLLFYRPDLNKNQEQLFFCRFTLYVVSIEFCCDLSFALPRILEHIYFSVNQSYRSLGFRFD